MKGLDKFHIFEHLSLHIHTNKTIYGIYQNHSNSTKRNSKIYTLGWKCDNTHFDVCERMMEDKSKINIKFTFSLLRCSFLTEKWLSRVPRPKCFQKIDFCSKKSLSLVWISQRKLMHDTGVVFMPVLQSHHNRKLRLSPVKGGRRELLNSWFRLLFAPSSPIIRLTFISQHFCLFFNHQVK